MPGATNAAAAASSLPSSRPPPTRVIACQARWRAAGVGRGHVGDLVLHGLEDGDLLAELLALLDVRDRHVEHRVHAADHLRQRQRDLLRCSARSAAAPCPAGVEAAQRPALSS